MRDFIVSGDDVTEWTHKHIFREHKHTKMQAKAFNNVLFPHGFYSCCKGWGISYYCQPAKQPPALLPTSNLTNKLPFWQVYVDRVLQGKYSTCKVRSTIGSWTVVQLKNRNAGSFSQTHRYALQGIWLPLQSSMDQEARGNTTALYITISNNCCCNCCLTAMTQRTFHSQCIDWCTEL